MRWNVLIRHISELRGKVRERRKSKRLRYRCGTMRWYLCMPCHHPRLIAGCAQGAKMGFNPGIASIGHHTILVYGRNCSNDPEVKVHRSRIGPILPGPEQGWCRKSRKICTRGCGHLKGLPPKPSLLLASARGAKLLALAALNRNPLAGVLGALIAPTSGVFLPLATVLLPPV